MAVASGSCEVALAVGVEKMTHAKTSLVTEALNCALDHEVDAASGLTYPGLFALVWQAHANKYGTTRADVSAVVKKNRSNGLMNPLASMGADLTDAEINQSAMIADPLTLFDCCPISDGAAAVVVTRKGSGSSMVQATRSGCWLQRRRPAAQDCRLILTFGKATKTPHFRHSRYQASIHLTLILLNYTIASRSRRSSTPRISVLCKDTAVVGPLKAGLRYLVICRLI